MFCFDWIIYLITIKQHNGMASINTLLKVVYQILHLQRTSVKINVSHNFKFSEIMWYANLMQLGNLIDVFLARHVLGTYAHHQLELQHMVFCTECLEGWWSWQPSRRSCVRCGWCHATCPKTWCRKPYAATQHLTLLMMGVCTWNMSS